MWPGSTHDDDALKDEVLNDEQLPKTNTGHNITTQHLVIHFTYNPQLQRFPSGFT